MLMTWCVLLFQVGEATTMTLPSNSLATDLQKGQFFPTRGQAVQVRTTADLESTGDIIDDVRAQEEHAKAIANIAEVCASHAAAISATIVTAGDSDAGCCASLPHVLPEATPAFAVNVDTSTLLNSQLVLCRSRMGGRWQQHQGQPR